jgi:hypothetical protein
VPVGRTVTNEWPCFSFDRQTWFDREHRREGKIGCLIFTSRLLRRALLFRRHLQRDPHSRTDVRLKRGLREFSGGRRIARRGPSGYSPGHLLTFNDSRELN